MQNSRNFERSLVHISLNLGLDVKEYLLPLISFRLLVKLNIFVEF